jgi:separase
MMALALGAWTKIKRVVGHVADATTVHIVHPISRSILHCDLLVFAVMPPSTSSRKVNTTLRNSKPKTIVSSSHELDEKLVDGSTTSKAKGKQKAKDKSPEERRVSAMLDVNASLHTLSSVAQSGWKANSEEGRTRSSALGKVSAAVARTNEALLCLRVICPDDLDVERAASSVMSKLLALEMVRLY